MTKLESLALDLAFLDNREMQVLARILVQNYPMRADTLESCISNNFQDLKTILVDKYAD